MKPVKNITPAPWMTSPETASVMRALQDESAPPQALFVGGCVRNLLLQKPVADIDIANLWSPQQVMDRLKKAGIKTIPTGLAHGTVTALTNNRTFEITTLRRDVRTDGRHAEVAFTDDWKQDAARRDFTMNALFADEKGHVFDPLGHGLADLEAGRVVFVGDPDERIAEDVLRILRFFRFHAYYGAGEPDGAALAACRKAADKIESLSRERMTQEVLKILAAPNAAQVFDLMRGCGVLADLPGPSCKSAVLKRLAGAQVQNLTRLAALGANEDQLEKFLRLSNAQKKTLNDLKKAQIEIETPDEKNIKRLVYRYGNDLAAQAMLLHAAKNDYEAGLETARNWIAPRLPIDGNDILAAGIPPGPEIATLLKKVEDWWLDNDCAPDRVACITFLKNAGQR